MHEQTGPQDHYVQASAGPTCNGEIPGSSQTQENPERPKPRTNSAVEQAAGQPLGDKSDCANIQSLNCTWSQATQVYLKMKTQCTCCNYVTAELDSEKFIYNALQKVVQQMQKHMFAQLQQLMQQTYSGLTLGTPVGAEEYVSTFTNSEEALILTNNSL